MYAVIKTGGKQYRVSAGEKANANARSGIATVGAAFGWKVMG